ncbi:MAG: hypothetical protein FRX48_05103 [Lasallia pustulata]|uniref:PSI domain-containing protein n=1 Tax=Lasallia pustulata TaxID=136370 RepID=A0A5M8PMV3_9LECA|nr:MAG: hypothetical protein FRX48_05103 [Lasallia pustulata]
MQEVLDQQADDLFYQCWRLQDCSPCLHSHHPCGWCPTSSTCVPNVHSFLPILAPIRNPDICPHWSERWDLRTKGLGCYVSTVTFLTCIISIASTLLVLGLGWASFKLGKFCWGRWKRRERGWWTVWRCEKWRWFWGWRLVLRKKSSGCGNGDERVGQEADERTGLTGG